MISFIKKNRVIIAILSASLIVRLLFLFDYHDIWWDSAVYVGMAKFLFSFGNSGLWEHIRPIFWPFLLGISWKTGADIIIAGRVMTLLSSIAVIYLTFLISKKVFDSKTAVISAILLSFSSIFFFFTFRLYAEIPAICFIMLGIWLYLEKRHTLSGLFIGLAFLTKFPAGIFIAVLAIVHLGEVKRFLRLSIGFLMPVVIYFVFNMFMYGNPISPVLFARSIIGKVLGCNVLFKKPVYYYFVMILKDNYLNIFLILGVYYILKDINRNKRMVLLSFLFPLVYFTQLNCKDYRYMIIFLPFMAMITAYGIKCLLKNIFSRWKFAFSISIIIILSLSVFLSMSYYSSNESKVIDYAYREFYTHPDNVSFKGELLTSNPLVVLYTDSRAVPLYYPLYDSKRAYQIREYVINNSEDISYVFLDTCQGGMICPEDDLECPEQTRELMQTLDLHFLRSYYEQSGRCEYYVYSH